MQNQTLSRTCTASRGKSDGPQEHWLAPMWIDEQPKIRNAQHQWTVHENQSRNAARFATRLHANPYTSNMLRTMPSKT